MVGRLRLWSGYVLLFYVTTHLLNHALGLISLRFVEAGRVWFVFIWQGYVGQTALYGALLLHLVLAMWALLRRRTLRLSAWEWTQFALGWSLIPLGALHVVGTRVAHDIFGVHPGYPWVLASLVVVIVGGIDLSVGSMFALTDFCALYTLDVLGWPVPDT